jgi:hypothetical protein
MMTKAMLIQQLTDLGGDPDGEVQVYIREDGVEGWYEMGRVSQLGSSDPVATVLDVGDCIAANSAGPS